MQPLNSELLHQIVDCRRLVTSNVHWRILQDITVHASLCAQNWQWPTWTLVIYSAGFFFHLLHHGQCIKESLRPNHSPCFKYSLSLISYSCEGLSFLLWVRDMISTEVFFSFIRATEVITPALYLLQFALSFYFNIYFVTVIILCVIWGRVLLPLLARSPL